MSEGGRSRTARDPVLDVLRAFALCSMVSLHVSLHGPRNDISRVFHSAKWIDGAFFFVALSGIVTGLVHRRIVEGRGMRVSATKLGRRAMFLYAVHLTLTFLIVGVHTLDPKAIMPYTPAWSANVVAQIFALRVEPDATAVLPMYVFFLLWAVLAVRLLSRGHPVIVGALSVAAYVFGHTVAGMALSPGTFQVLNWQLLFTGGLLAGWSWDHERLRVPRSVRVTTLGVSSAVAATLLLLSRTSSNSIDHLAWRPVDKASGGLIAFGFAGAALVIGYVAITRLRQHDLTRKLLVPVAAAGSKGLPGYVAMVLCVLVLQIVPQLDRTNLTVVVVIVICGLTEYVALRLDARRRSRTVTAPLHAPPHAAGRDVLGWAAPPPPPAPALEAR